MRIEHNALVKKIIEAGRTRRRKRGRPRKSWLETIKDLEEEGGNIIMISGYERE